MGRGVLHHVRPVPLGHQAPRHPHVRMDLPHPVDLIHQAVHPRGGEGVRQHRDDDAVGGVDGGHAGRREIGRAVDDDHVVGVVLHGVVPQIPQGVGRPVERAVPGVLLKVDAPQLLGGGDHIQVWNARGHDHLVVHGGVSAQQPRQAGALPVREQGVGSVGLGVRVDQQHPAPVLGGQQIGQVDGSGGLAHAALHVQNRKCSHGMYLQVIFLRAYIW